MKTLFKSAILALILISSFSVQADEQEYVGYFAAQIKLEWYKIKYATITPNKKLRMKIINAAEVLVDLKDGMMIKRNKQQIFQQVDPAVLRYLRALPDSTDRVMRGEVIK